MTCDIWKHVTSCGSMVWFEISMIWWVWTKNSNLSSFAMHIWVHWGPNTNFHWLHWNQKYQKVQVAVSVSLHLRLLSLDFSRRQEQCLRKSIDILDNRCPWLDWQYIEVTGALCTLNALKMYFDQKCGGFEFFNVPFTKKPSGHVEVMWPAQGCFWLCQIENQNGGLANRTNLTNTARV